MTQSLTAPVTKQQNRIDPLTGIRAIAAIMVFLYHHRKFWRNDIPGFVLNFLNEFHVGVSIFFVLSGFLIAYIYKEDPLQSKRHYLRYLLIRFFRIFPIYLLLLSVKYVVLGFPPASETFLTYTLLHGFSSRYNLSGIPQAWTLNVELCFYLAAPVIYFLCKRSIIKTAGFLLALLLLFFAIGYSWHYINGNPGSFLYPAFFIFNTTFAGRSVEFLAGILLALIIQRPSSLLYRFKQKTLAGGLSVLALIYTISLFEPDIFNHGTDHPAGLVLRNLVLPFFVSLFLWGLITERTLVQKILGSKLLVLMGNASYIFYLIHIGIINAKLIELHYFADHNFTLLWIVAILIYLIIERPFYEFMKKQIKRI